MPKTDDIPRGQLSTIILKTLLDNDKYGYEIINDVAEQTNGKIAIKQPSLYSCLRRMEEQSLISSYWRDSSLGGRRHYYRITDYGKKYVEKWQADILTSSPNFDNEQTNLETQNNKPVFLEQENFFQEKNKIEKNTINNQEEMPVDNSFVQYDLFTQSTFIAKPSVEVFETIKDKQQENNTAETFSEENIEINDRIALLRNNISENNKSNAEPEPINIKQEFILLKKKQKSFTESYKEEVHIDDGKILESNIEFNLTEPIVNNATISENFENDIIQDSEKEKQLLSIQDDSNNFVSLESDSVSEDNYKDISNTDENEIESIKPPVFVDLDEELPTIFKSTKDFSENNEDYSLLSNVDTEPINTQSDEKNIEQENKNKFEEEKVDNKNNQSSPIVSKDDGVFITEKTDPSSTPKVKRIAPNRFEHFNTYNESEDIITKLYERKQAQTTQEEMISTTESSANALNDEENYSNDTSFTEVNAINYTNFEQLALYYKQNGVNFSSYKKPPKSLKAHNSTYVKTNKFNMFISLSLFTLIFIQTLIVGIICSPLQPALWFIYLFAPIISAIISVYYIITFLKNKTKLTAKTSLKDFNFVINTIVSLIAILMIFSINLICGMSYTNLAQYSTSFIYLSILTLNFPLFSLIKLIVLKSKLADA